MPEIVVSPDPADGEAAATRQCWICFSEEPVGSGDMVRPCKCRGTSGWVHHGCLLDWIQVRSGQAGASYASLNSSALLAPSCPQCATPYVIREKYSLPRGVMSFVLQMRKWRDTVLLGSLFAGTGVLLYGAAWGYGLCAFASVSGPNEFGSFFRQHLARVSNSPTADSLIKSFIGIPLITLGTLSWNFSSLSWVFPLLPPILFANDVISWNSPLSPKMCTLMLPMGLFAYRLLWTKVYPGLAKNWLARYGLKDVESSSYSDLPTPTLTLSGTANSPLNLGGAAAGQEISDEDDDDSIDDRELRVSLLSITANLTFPFAAAFVGYLLFGRRLSSWLPFHRALVGGSLLLLSQDILHFFLWWQRVAIRPFRRILNYSPSMDCLKTE